MEKMFHVNYGEALTGTLTGMEGELQACRACLATDTKLYRLRDGLAEAYEYLIGMPITTAFVRSIDRMSHKLLLEFTLGLDSKVINIVHHDDAEIDLDKRLLQYDDHGQTILDTDETDGLTDVLNDFEEIRESLNEDNVDFNNEFNDGTDFEENSFNDHVDDLLHEKEMNGEMNGLVEKSFSAKNINNDIVGIIHSGFKDTDLSGKKAVDESENLTAVKKAPNKESSRFNEAEELLNTNINDSLPEVINFNDVSINTTDLNENDNSNLVETFNNFILDHDYLDEKFLIETGDSEMAKKFVIHNKVEEEPLLKEIIPTITKKDKELIIKDLENSIKAKTIEKPKKETLADTSDKDITKKQSKPKNPKKNEEKSNLVPIITKMEILDDFKVDLSSDFVKFGDDFNFKVFAMSREEQLEELQKKRESVLYLGAPYKCVQCAKGFRSEVTHKNHMQVHAPSYGKFECSVCRSRHKTDSRRRRHADTHRLRYCCTQCEFVARSREKAESHYEWHAGKTFSCDYCGEMFGCASTQLSHVRLRHPGACAACSSCGEAFVGARGLILHTKRTHPNIPSAEDKIELYCFTCRVQFKNREALNRHKAGSDRSCCSDMRTCAECGNSFESDVALSHHSHAPVKCQMCDASFSDSVSRRTHFERVHLNVRVKKQDSAVRARSAAKGCQERRKVVCELCGKKYQSAAALRYHHRSHSGERPFPCPRCHKSFAFNHSLQAHVRTHTGERPYRCSRCPQAFPNANNLARHNKTVHLGQKQYSRCSVCLKWLTSPSGMKIHMATVHHHAPCPSKNNI